MEVIFNIPCPHCGCILAIPQDHAKEIVPSLVVVIDTCDQCQNIFVSINNKVRALKPSIMRSGNADEIQKHFINQMSDLGATILDDLKMLDIFGKSGGRSTKIISAMDAKQFPKYDFPELDEDGITGPWDEGYEDDILDTPPDCPGKNFGGMHQSVEDRGCISDQELNDFKKRQVKLIDDRRYFRRHFG